MSKLHALSEKLVRDTESQIAELRQQAAQHGQQAAQHSTQQAALTEQANSMEADIAEWRAAIDSAKKRKAKA